MNRYSLNAILLLIFIAFGLQEFLALPKLSATSDEIPHLAAGYSYWVGHDFRMNPEHPPLAKLVAALPLLVLKPKLNLTSAEWAGAEEYPFGHNFLYSNDADRLLFWGRLPMILLAGFGGLTVFLWARDMFGTVSGFFAFSLYAFSPTLLAHGMLITTDVPLATFMTLALYLLWKQGSQPSLRSGAFLGIAVGAAMACKFSGALLPVLIVALTVWRCLRAENRRQQVVTEAKSLAIAGMVALLVIEASYFFLVPPWTYLQNMKLVNANHNANRLFYLFGDFSRTGWWYYFVLAFGVKATLASLLAISLATLHWISDRFIDRWGEIIILAAIFSYAAAVTAGADQIGVRYLVPLFPLLFVWSSRIAVELKTKAAGIAFLIAIVAGQAYSAVTAFPNYIPYFNEMVGGPSQGIEYLDDSNVDWGQGIKQAAEYVRKHKLTSVEFLPFSPFDNPRYYGISTPPRPDLETYRMTISGTPHPGVYIVSAHHLIRMMRIRPEWQPARAIDRIGDSLWVYRF